MTIDAPQAVAVNILNKPYQVTCQENEAEALNQSAEYLNGKMHQIQTSGRVVGMEKIAIMAALNITHELLNLKQHIKEQKSKSPLIADPQKLDKSLHVLYSKIKEAVGRNK